MNFKFCFCKLMSIKIQIYRDRKNETNNILAAAYMAIAISDGVCFANVAFLQSLPSTPLN